MGLGISSPLRPNATKRIEVNGYSGCYFDVRVEFSNGTYAYWTNVNLCNVETLTVRA
jgi:hypothetical protein